MHSVLSAIFLGLILGFILALDIFRSYFGFYSSRR